jgi:TolB-like protein/DNA-binding winged helix-turn-helix (wHTH) protein
MIWKPIQGKGFGTRYELGTLIEGVVALILGGQYGSHLATNTTRSGTYRFGSFEFDLETGELRKKGFRVRLEGQPIAVLTILLEHPGELVAREDLQRRLWPSDTFVDFEQSLNAAIRRLRLALDDSAASPRYVETLARRGYRWIAPVQEVPVGGELNPDTSAVPEPAQKGRQPQTALLLAGLAVILIVAVFVVRRVLRPSPGIVQGRLLIAVTPLQNLSGDPGQNYFAQGLTEEIITQLGQLSPERIGVVRYRSSAPGQQTGSERSNSSQPPWFRYLLEGSVRRQNEQVRISVRLVREPDQAAVWTESFDRNVADVLSLQSEIAQRIGRELQINVLGRTARPPVKPEVVEAYLRGRFELTQDIFPVSDAARAHFEQAIALDPSYAPAHAGLADFYVARAVGTDEGSEQAWRLAEQHVTQALSLESESAETHVSIAIIRLLHDWDWPGARQHALRALQLNPSLAESHSAYALYLRIAGNIPEDLNQRKQAVALDPYRVDLKRKLRFEQLFAHDYQGLVRSDQEILASDPNDVEARYGLCTNLGRLKLFKEAADECAKELVLEGHPDWAAGYTREYSKNGYEAANLFVAKKRLSEVLAQPQPDLWELANAFVAAGMTDEAFQVLFRGVQMHEPGLLQIRVDPDFDRIRNDPRYLELIRQIGFPNE